MAAPTVLRAATHRLTTTPVNELPSIATYLATCLGDCRDFLCAPQSQKKPAGQPDTALLVQKLKSRITSLLQDKSVEGRWTAVILVKAAIEAGQWEILRACEPWVRSMLAILGRPDPVSTKKLCIVTLTRVFQLTRAYQSLVREVTTPSLPPCITACLNLVSVKETGGQNRKLKGNLTLLEPVLSSLLELLPHHPTVFRPFSAQIHSLILPLIGASPSVHHVPDSSKHLARRLFVSLHHCAPKNATGEEWLKACKSTVASIHQTCDNLFRAVVEQWESVDPSMQQISRPRNYSRAVGDEGSDALGLPEWQGIHVGSQRVISLLDLLSGFISMRTNSPVSIPIGSILDMTSRLTSMIVPSSYNDQSPDGVAVNPEVGQDERTELWSELPNIHRAVLTLLSSIVKVFGSSTISIAQSCLDQAFWVFEAEKFNTGIRTVSYELVDSILPIIGPSMIKSGVSSLASIIRHACHDQLSDDFTGSGQHPAKSSTSKTNQPSHNADTFLGSQSKSSTKGSTTSNPPETIVAASNLLSTAFNFLPSEFISPPIRAEMDRTAILTGRESVMMSSTLNPVPITKGTRSILSILPFLARRHAKSIGIEGLLRPRMPVLMNQSKFTAVDFEDEEEDTLRPAASVPGINDQSGENMFSQGVFSGTENLPTAGTKRAHHDELVTPLSEPTSNITDESSSQPKRARVETSQFTSSFTGSAPVQREPASQPAVPLQTALQPEPSKTDDAVSAAMPALAQSTGSSAPVSTSTITRTETREPGSSTAQLGSRAVVGEGIGQTNEGDESDDEIPSLNMEPDTDEDEE